MRRTNTQFKMVDKILRLRTKMTNMRINRIRNKQVTYECALNSKYSRHGQFPHNNVMRTKMEQFCALIEELLL